MKIAICLYGQPRNYLKGHENIKNFMDNNKHCTFEIFFHTWLVNDDQYYKCSNWRKIERDELKVDSVEKLKSDLISIYKPVAFKFQNTINKFTKHDLIINSISYNNSKKSENDNACIHNLLSQCYSRTEVRNLLNEYISKTDNSYDMIVTCRFDFCKPINFRFQEINTDNIYVSNLHSPRKIIADNFSVAPQNVFLKWFGLYDNLENIINNKNINETMKMYNENFCITMESYLFANYIYHFDINRIVYTDKIGDFH